MNSLRVLKVSSKLALFGKRRSQDLDSGNGLPQMKMRKVNKDNFRSVRWECCIGLMLWALVATMGAGAAEVAANLAANRPATSSSIENDEHDASRANDGKPETCWRADDEPEGGPEWWQVDLGKGCNLSACQITWPYDRMNYRFKVEGSADQKNWVLLSDQTNTTSRAQVQRLGFDHTRGIRYVKITVTGFDEGCWASLSEVKVYGSYESHQ
jgi:hypothetical protein